MAELAVLTGAIGTVKADLIASWWSSWSIVTELAVITSAVLTSEALAYWLAATESSWSSTFMAESAVFASAVLAIEADLIAASWWAGGTAFMAELAVLAGAVLTIVADLLGTKASLAFFTTLTTFWVWTMGESAVLSLAVSTFEAVFLATAAAAETTSAFAESSFTWFTWLTWFTWS